MRGAMIPRETGFERMIALKRIVTGTLGIGAGVGMIVMTVGLGHPASPLSFLAATIFFGGGAWSLRDAYRYFFRAR